MSGFSTKTYVFKVSKQKPTIYKGELYIEESEAAWQRGELSFQQARKERLYARGSRFDSRTIQRDGNGRLEGRFVGPENMKILDARGTAEGRRRDDSSR